MTEPIYSRPDGTYVIEHNGYPYHVIESDPLFAEVTAYLLDHPEALIHEPVPPPPTEEQLASTIRSQRDALMRTNVDCYNAARWETMTEDEREAVRVYRQLLLDITDQETFPQEVMWPVIEGVN